MLIASILPVAFGTGYSHYPHLLGEGTNMQRGGTVPLKLRALSVDSLAFHPSQRHTFLGLHHPVHPQPPSSLL